MCCCLTQFSHMNESYSLLYVLLSDTVFTYEWVIQLVICVVVWHSFHIWMSHTACYMCCCLTVFTYEWVIQLVICVVVWHSFHIWMSHTACYMCCCLTQFSHMNESYSLLYVLLSDTVFTYEWVIQLVICVVVWHSFRIWMSHTACYMCCCLTQFSHMNESYSLLYVLLSDTVFTYEWVIQLVICVVVWHSFHIWMSHTACYMCVLRLE